MNIKLFADGANLQVMRELATDPRIKGFTTNPTLMHKAGVRNYQWFAETILKDIKELPISFEVFADKPDDMYKQAKQISTWGKNVYVKIPVTNTKGEPLYRLIKTLTYEGVKVNVTAMMTPEQTLMACDALQGGSRAYLSIFAGRIADTGVDPIPYMKIALDYIKLLAPNAELIWASPREVLNIYQADAIGCHIITATPDIIKKLSLAGIDLNKYSLETVKMFYNDALESGFTL